MNKLLLVDDDVELMEVLQKYLENESFEVHVVNEGEAALKQNINDFSLVVLDVMMPGLNGIDVLKLIRQNSSVPVLMLTARGDDIDRIVGLELGADDYVPKPCTPRELVARIRAILRRSESEKAFSGVKAVIRAGNLTMSSQSRKAEWKEQPLALTSTQFNLLEVLARNAGEAVSKDVLSKQGLGRELSPYDRSIDVHMSDIRQKLGSYGDNISYIQTIRGVGYQLIKEQ